MTSKILLSSVESRNAYGAFLEDGGTRVYVDDEAGLLEEDTEYERQSYQKSFPVPMNGNQKKRTSKGKPTKGSKEEKPNGDGRTSSSEGGSSQLSGKKGSYDLWGISRSESVSSLSSDGSTELFSRESSSKGSSHSCHDSSPFDMPRMSSRSLWKIIIVALLGLCFLVVEVVGGYYASSLAVFSDAGSVLGDVSGFMISLCVFVLSRKSPNSTMNFGYFRSEVLGALGCVLVMWVVTGILVYEGILRIIKTDYVINADVMVAISGAGFVFNGLTGIILQGWGCRPKDPEQKLDDLVFRKSFNIRSNYLHILGNMLMSLGLLTAALTIKYYPQYKFVDPILTFIFGLIVLLTTIPILRDVTRILMEGCPKEISFKRLRSDLERLPGVRTVHDLRIWALAANKNALSVHLTIDASFPSETVLTSAQQLLRDKYQVLMATIQVEPFSQDMEACEGCALPREKK